MPYRRHVILAACALALAGCATPNVQPFAEQTAALATAVSGEQKRIAVKYEQVVDLYSEACKRAGKRAQPKSNAPAKEPDCSTRDKLKEDAKTYSVVREALESVFASAVIYATRLAELSSAGETGSAAAQSLLGSLQRLGSIGGFAVAAPIEGLKVALDKIATAVTRVQAQDSLAQATATADAAIQAIADGIAEIRVAEANHVNSLFQGEIAVALTLANEDLVGLFEDATISREALSANVRMRTAQLAKLNECGPEPDTRPQPGKKASTDPCDLLRADLRGAEELGRLLEQLRPQYDEYMARRAAAVRWRAERKENFTMVGKAAQAWKAEHAKVVQYLQRCGGLRAVRCGTLDAGALRSLIDHIKELRSSREN
jgi:hypothetical protein